MFSEATETAFMEGRRRLACVMASKLFGRRESRGRCVVVSMK